MKFRPLQLGRRPEPFSHQDWLFEIKYDGFRALAQIEQGRCKLVSRDGNEFKFFRTLSESLATELKRSVILGSGATLSSTKTISEGIGANRYGRSGMWAIIHFLRKIW